MILYMFKIHIGAAPDLGFLSECTIRHGTKYHPKYNRKASADAKAIRYSSFFTQGPLLFNLLPADLRKPVNAITPEEKKKQRDRFKLRVDKWLELIPDQPTTTGLDHRAAVSNSIIGQMGTHGREVNRKWPAISRQLDIEEARQARTTNNNNAGNSSGWSNRPRVGLTGAAWELNGGSRWDQ